MEKVKKTVFILAFSSFLGGCGAGVMLPLLPTYSAALGANPVVITLVVGVFPLFSMGTTYILGFFYNRFDGKHLLILGTALGSLSTLFFAFSAGWMHLLLLRMLMGAGSGMAGLASSTILSVTLKESAQKGKYFGILTSLSFISTMMVGPSLSALLYTVLKDFSPIFVVIAVFLCLSLLMITFLDSQRIGPPTSPSVREVFTTIRNELHSLAKPGSFRYSVNVLGLVQGGAVGFLGSVILIYLYTDVKMTVQEVGLLMTTAGVFGVISRPLVGHLCDKVSKVAVTASGFIARIVAIVLVLTALKTQAAFLFIFLGAAFYTYATASVSLSLLTLVSQTERPERMGMTMSRLGVASSSGELLIPPLGGLLYQGVSHEAPFYFLILSCLSAFPVIVILQKNLKS